MTEKAGHYKLIIIHLVAETVIEHQSPQYQYNCFLYYKVASTNSSYIRLSDGKSTADGRIEINIDGSWGTVCSNNFDDVDAQVICKMTGLP